MILEDEASALVRRFVQRVSLQDIAVGDVAARDLLTRNDWNLEKSITCCIETMQD